MFVPTTVIVHPFKYMTRVYFNDGREPLVIENEVESKDGLPQFKLNVKEWNRKGQAMKDSPSLSHIQGYDYWVSIEQEAHNAEVTYKRKTEFVYVAD